MSLSGSASISLRQRCSLRRLQPEVFSAAPLLPLIDLPEISHNYSDSRLSLTSRPALPWKRLPSREGGRIGVKGICISHRPYLIKNPDIANKEKDWGQRKVCMCLGGGGGVVVRMGGLFNFHTLLAPEGLSHPWERYRVAACGFNGRQGWGKDRERRW